jgi:hypothetical protein
VELANPITVVTGHEMLTCIFGRWPSFHDAEVVDLAIWRGDVDPDRKKYTFPVLTAKILVNELVPEQTNESRLRIVPQAHVTFRFYDVDDLKLDGFNHVNQIVGLSFAIQPRGSFTDGSELQPYIVVEFQRGFGIAASFKCFRVEVVDVTPYQADPL